jgi:hypothetical protein
MDTLIGQLNQKYNDFLRTLRYKEPADSVAFGHAFDYFCIIEKQPRIKEIIDNDRKEIGYKKDAVVFNHPSVDEQKDIMSRIEWNSLSFCYDEMLRDMYIPMIKYEQSLDTLTPKDIIGSTEIRRKKFINTMFYFVKKVGKLFVGTDRSDNDLEARMALGKIEYNFKDEKYQIYMSRIHSILIPQLLEIHTQKPKDVSDSEDIHGVYFDKENSILTIGDKQVQITLKNDKTNGHFVLEYIFENGVENPADYKDILASKFKGDRKNNMAMYQACNDINKKVSKQAGVGEFLDIHSGNTGWVQIYSNFL